MRMAYPLGLTSLLLLGACGGGGGGGGDTTNPPPSTAPFGLTARPVAVAPNFDADLGSVGAIRLTPVATGFNEPVLMLPVPVPASGGRHAVLEKGGRLLILDSAFAVESTLLDLSALVVTSSEQGLLGAAFDPDIASNGFFYVHYNSARSGGRCAAAADPRCSRIVRYRLNGSAGNWQYSAIDPATGSVLLEVSQPFENHKGGMIAFGPDNYLYIAFGDGGSGGDPQNNAQNRATLLGKLLRIDPHGAAPYAIPPDNPFVGATDGSRGEIWAYGLRNPWRFSFDLDGDALWLADVGQNAWEEIDRITRGGNYGWNLREGSHPYNGGSGSNLIDPVWQYGRDEGQSVTGGYVYRGAAMPGLDGQYLYGDFASGRLWALDTGNGSNRLLLDSGLNISSFSEDAQGELYVVDYGGGLYRIDAASGNASTAPATLSATGLFSTLSPLQPISGLVEYEVNVPLWSDGTVKRRWFGLPAGADITFDSGTFDDDDAWQLPTGSVVVKEFSIALDARAPSTLRKLETRVLFHSDNGWIGFTYRWNNAQTEATLTEAGASGQLTFIRSDGSSFNRRYDYPSSAQCRSCHTRAAGFLLGLRTRQINRDFNFGSVTDNQLRSYNHVGLFDIDIGSAAQYAAAVPLNGSASIAQRARDYLDANCAHCHQPNGPTGSSLDLRASTTLAAMNAVNIAPTAGNLGIANARIIAAGSKERSLLWERMRRTDPAQGRMPPLASHAVDDAAVSVVGSWIDGL